MNRILNRLAVVVAGTTALVAFAAAAPASADGTAGSYRGNVCSSHTAETSGADACYFVDHFEANRRFVFALGAYDFKSDRYSARNVSYVQQYFPGDGWYTSGTYSVTTRHGYGYSEIGAQHVVTKNARATKIRIVVNACTYDTNKDVYGSCTNKTWTSAWSG